MQIINEPVIKKLWLPVILLWRDRRINAGGADRVQIPWVYIAKGRKLEIYNINPNMHTVIDVQGSCTNHGKIKINRRKNAYNKKER